MLRTECKLKNEENNDKEDFYYGIRNDKIVKIRKQQVSIDILHFNRKSCVLDICNDFNETTDGLSFNKQTMKGKSNSV